ncbi:hypothetical protein B5J92_08635 [Moraxella atlantae]|nr:hypothetical protein B5J92_08635 [Moraxella atlantae]
MRVVVYDQGIGWGASNGCSHFIPNYLAYYKVLLNNLDCLSLFAAALIDFFACILPIDRFALAIIP